MSRILCHTCSGVIRNSVIRKSTVSTATTTMFPNIMNFPGSKDRLVLDDYVIALVTWQISVCRYRMEAGDQIGS